MSTEEVIDSGPGGANMDADHMKGPRSGQKRARRRQRGHSEQDCQDNSEPATPESAAEGRKPKGRQGKQGKGRQASQDGHNHDPARGNQGRHWQERGQEDARKGHKGHKDNHRQRPRVKIPGGSMHSPGFHQHGSPMGSPGQAYTSYQHHTNGQSSPLAISGGGYQAGFYRQHSGSPHSPGAYFSYSPTSCSPYGQDPGRPVFQAHSPQQGHGYLGQHPCNPGNPGNGNMSGKKQRHRQKNGNPPGQRKKVFQPHWSMEDVSHGLKRGELLQGALRINPKNYEDCYIPHPDGVSDVYIRGLADRNRALNGDIVAVQLHSRADWKVLIDEPDTPTIERDMQNLRLGPSGKQSDQAKAGAADAEQAASTDMATPVEATGRNSSKKPVNAGKSTPRKHTTLREYASTPEVRRVTKRLFVDSASEPQPKEEGKVGNEQSETDTQVKEDKKETQQTEAELQQCMDAVPDTALLRTGKVVAIIERKHSRAATGSLCLMSDQNRQTALFMPLDHRVPRMMIPMDDCPQGFYERPDDHAKVLYVARLTDWEEHSNYARGTLSRSLGEAGEIEPETEGILMSYDVDYSDFSEEVLACLPQQLPWSIPSTEFDYRKDLRKECIFTIDPATARDLDDALHVKHLGDGVYEVGVHIADVSFFVEHGTALDKVAGDRSTSVYLVQKVIPMLPRLLCEQLCSLNPDEDRLAFSVIWKMTEDGQILDEWFGRSVIRSCVKMSYDHAQGFIEEPDRKWTQEELPPISGGFSIDTIKEKVLYLRKIAKSLRQKRFDDGALRLDQVKLSFTLDKESGMPSGYWVYQQKESNSLIEEFMLLANMAVAHKIYKAFPELAVLRRHPPPQARMMDELWKTCHSLGIPIDISSSHTLHESIKRLAGDTLEDAARVQILTAMCSKPMQNALYFCTGCLVDETLFRHYALNVPLYTHFTSPIRRYPDVMVHRLLAAALGYGPVSDSTKEMVARLATHANDKKTNAKQVQERSSDLFFAVFVKECGPLEEKGMVMNVLDKSFDVLILKLGVVKRVYCEKLPLRSFSFQRRQRRPELILTWARTEQHGYDVRQELTIFTQVNCMLSSEDEPLKWKAIIKHPEHNNVD